MSVRTTFNYPNTCPTIDKNISIFRNTLRNEITDIIRELCPKLAEEFEDTSNYQNLLHEYTERIYNQAEPIFENVRTCNSDMREEIEAVIVDFVDEISDSQRDLKDVEYELEKAKERVSYLEQEVENLNNSQNGE